MQTLESLPSITRVSSYTGEGKQGYIDELESTLKKYSDLSRQLVSDIILTHRHHDHTNGLPSVLKLLNGLWPHTSNYVAPRIHKYPILPNEDENVLSLLKGLSLDIYAKAPDFANLHSLQHAQTLTSPGCTLQVFHTPGHTVDSICLHLSEENALFSADTVLGQGTAVFEDLSAYMRSLQDMLRLNNQQHRSFERIYPGHGPIVNDGPKLIKEYIDHRMQRENQIENLMTTMSSDGYIWTIEELVARIYANYPKPLWGPAAGSLQLHLQKLKEDRKVIHLDGQDAGARWVLASKYSL
ncbi:hypothetical protein Clacol_006456 [Clathrus columnatus]|uniref:Metallo-beta-lactamase domain-containing protein n=1 Tax=Clathrus columnatus TaxID=1419009 RepID=A0AAV5AH51_9AGAM|nr:hypothetical protein Clacol_006456 [Clathrus columnatus]